MSTGNFKMRGKINKNYLYNINRFIQDTSDTPKSLESLTDRDIVRQIAVWMKDTGNVASAIDIADDTLENEFGISSGMYSSFYGFRSSIENSNDLVLVVSCEDQYKDEVKNLCNDYINKISNNLSLQDDSSYIKKIYTYDKYVMLEITKNDTEDSVMGQIKDLDMPEA